MIRVFMHNIFKYHGIQLLQSLTMDNKSIWRDLFKNMHTTFKWLLSSIHQQTEGSSEKDNSTVLDLLTNYSQTDRQSEETNFIILNLLKCHVSDHKEIWEDYLS